MFTVKNITGATLVILTAFVLSGCGIPGGNTSASPSDARPSAPPITENPASPSLPDVSDLPSGDDVVALRASVLEKPGAQAQERTLVCEGTKVGKASTIDNAEELCANIPESWDRVFNPDPKLKQVGCTAIYGGPSVAELAGTFRGQEVTHTFTMTDGCKINEWNAFEKLLGRAVFDIK